MQFADDRPATGQPLACVHHMTAAGALALSFGRADAPLFGMLHRPIVPARLTGLVICNSWGSEYRRTYRGLAKLAAALCERGFCVLRFDYSGTGDSWGDARTGSLEQWLQDLRLAGDTLMAHSNCETLGLVGLRFGALLAQHAVATGYCRASSVALWDSPPSGEVFVRNLQQLDAAWNEQRSLARRKRSQLRPPARDELLGYDWPQALAEEIVTLPGLRDDLPGRVIFVSRDRVPPDSAESIHLPDAGHWSDVARIASPWLPAGSLRIVAERLANGLP